jgi:hypothetical protein
LEYTQKCGGVKPINEIPTLPILIIGSPTVQNLIEKQTMIIKKQPCTMYVYANLAIVWFEFLVFMFIFSILSAISGLSGLLFFWAGGGRVSCKESTYK